MEEANKEQIEALEMAIEYIDKLLPAFQTVSEELKKEKKEDTIAFMNQAIEGLNFIIEIFNATADLISGDKEVFQKDVIEEKMQAMNQAIGANDDAKTADAIDEGVIPFLDSYAKIAKVYLAQR